MRWAVLLLVAGACYAPTVPTGAPCDKDHPCPRPLVCATSTSTCERTEIEIDAAAPDAPEQQVDAFVPPIDAPPVMGCTVMGFDVCGDGIDQDCDGADSVCAANDLAADAIDVTMGGVKTGDLLLARDNAPQKGCGDHGGRELFYKVTLGEPQVYYFDTFTSNFDSTVRVFPGKACTAITPSDLPSCSDDACGGSQSQLSVELPTGTSCVVVDQAATATQGAMTLKVTPAEHDGQLLLPGPRTITGNNSTAPDHWKGSCGGVGGKDVGYFFTVCPGVTATVDASTCVDETLTHFDTVLFLRKGGTSGFGATIACSDDASACTARPERPTHADGSILEAKTVTGAGVFFLIVDGYDTGDEGGYALDVNLH